MTGFEGLDASAREFVDLDTAGIIDPTKVVRVALENAVSVAGVMLLAEATMVELDEPESPSPQPTGSCEATPPRACALVPSSTSGDRPERVAGHKAPRQAPRLRER